MVIGVIGGKVKFLEEFRYPQTQIQPNDKAENAPPELATPSIESGGTESLHSKRRHQKGLYWKVEGIVGFIRDKVNSHHSLNDEQYGWCYERLAQSPSILPLTLWLPSSNEMLQSRAQNDVYICSFIINDLKSKNPAVILNDELFVDILEYLLSLCEDDHNERGIKECAIKAIAVLMESLECESTIGEELSKWSTGQILAILQRVLSVVVNCYRGQRIVQAVPIVFNFLDIFEPCLGELNFRLRQTFFGFAVRCFPTDTDDDNFNDHIELATFLLERIYRGNAYLLNENFWKTIFKLFVTSVNTHGKGCKQPARSITGSWLVDKARLVIPKRHRRLMKPFCKYFACNLPVEKFNEYLKNSEHDDSGFTSDPNMEATTDQEHLFFDRVWNLRGLNKCSHERFEAKLTLLMNRPPLNTKLLSMWKDFQQNVADSARTQQRL